MDVFVIRFGWTSNDGSFSQDLQEVGIQIDDGCGLWSSSLYNPDTKVCAGVDEGGKNAAFGGTLVMCAMFLL